MISASSAEQRKGRAGRTSPGICYRMCSEEDYNSMAKVDKAEIFLRPLGITVTLLKVINSRVVYSIFYYLLNQNWSFIQAMKVDPFHFDWLEPPDRTAIEVAIEELSLLGALDHRQNLTGLGTLISDLQIDPGIARMIYCACTKGLGMHVKHLNLNNTYTTLLNLCFQAKYQLFLRVYRVWSFGEVAMKTIKKHLVKLRKSLVIKVILSSRTTSSLNGKPIERLIQHLKV